MEEPLDWESLADLQSENVEEEMVLQANNPPVPLIGEIATGAFMFPLGALTGAMGAI